MYKLHDTRAPYHRGLRDYVNYDFVLPTSKGSLTGLGQTPGGISGTTLALIGAGAVAVWYFFVRKK